MAVNKVNQIKPKTIRVPVTFRCGHNGSTDVPCMVAYMSEHLDCPECRAKTDSAVATVVAARARLRS